VYRSLVNILSNGSLSGWWIQAPLGELKHRPRAPCVRCKRPENSTLFDQLSQLIKLVSKAFIKKRLPAADGSAFRTADVSRAAGIHAGTAIPSLNPHFAFSQSCLSCGGPPEAGFQMSLR
jgi:hypothetical protein